MSKTKNDKNGLPKGWEIKRLGDISETTSGGTPNRSNKAYWGGTIPWLKSGELTDSYVDTAEEFITEEGLRNSNAKIFEKGTLLIALYGATAGKLGILKFNTTTNQAVCAIKAINKSFDTKYVYYFLLQKRKEIIKDSFGGAQPNISQGYIRDLQTPLPPLPEQQRIVQQLDAFFERIDKAIQLTNENLEHCTHLLPAALNEVFGESEIASMQKLNDIALVARGKSKHRPRNDKKLFGGKYPFIQTGDVRNATKYITEYEQTYSEIGLAQSKLWPKGTICMTIAANIGDVAILGIDACFPDSVVGIQTNKKCNSEYLYYYLQTLQATLDKKSNAAAQKNINLNILEEVEVPIPDLHTQQHIVTYLNQLSSKQQQLQQHYSKQLQQLQALKSSLLDGAFKGEL